MLTTVVMYPIQGSFDTNKVQEWLDQRDDIGVDLLGSGVYMVGGEAYAVEALRKMRTENPERFPPCVLVRVSPDKIRISQEWGDKRQRGIACEFAKAIFEAGNCGVRDEYGKDLTEHVRKEGMDVLF
jgi:hypothetical protein